MLIRCKSAWIGLLVLVASSAVIGASLSIEGNLTQGALVVGRTEPGAEVVLDDRPVRVTKTGVFLIGFGRDASDQANLLVTYSDGSQTKRQLKVTKRDYRVQAVEGLPQRKVAPLPSDQKRIRAEAQLVQQARRRDDPRPDFLSGFIWPVRGRITGIYGSQRILNDVPRRPHYGVDIAAPAGTPVVAPANGSVTLVHEDMFFSGGTLILNHGHGLSSAFLHLNHILVRSGQAVMQGEVIAEVGATGRVTGAHLDWRINLFETRLDPALVVEALPARREVTLRELP